MVGAQVIGREAERQVIEQWLEDRPGALLIEGVAGIGKTTLWSYALDRATVRGDQVMSWRASVAERDIAFAVLTALFDAPMVSAVLAQLADPRRRALEVAVGRSDPERRPPEPSLVGLAVADVLRILVAHGPIVIGIDDLQWSDRASDEVLAFAARRLRAEPVGFVLARRTRSLTGPGSASVGLPDGSPVSSLALACERRERIEVGPLSVGSLGRPIHDRLGVAHPRPLLVRVHEACSGNSFLALEISRSLLTRAVALTPGEPFPVPPEAGPLVRDHLATLSRDARRSVVLVALSADPSLALVERVLGKAGSRAVDEACEKGVLVADGLRLRAYHPLFTSTAYADAPPGERRALRRAPSHTGQRWPPPFQRQDAGAEAELMRAPMRRA